MQCLSLADGFGIILFILAIVTRTKLVLEFQDSQGKQIWTALFVYITLPYCKRTESVIEKITHWAWVRRMILPLSALSKLKEVESKSYECFYYIFFTSSVKIFWRKSRSSSSVTLALSSRVGSKQVFIDLILCLNFPFNPKLTFSGPIRRMNIHILKVLSWSLCVYTLVKVTEHHSHSRDFHSACQHTVLRVFLLGLSTCQSIWPFWSPGSRQKLQL